MVRRLAVVIELERPSQSYNKNTSLKFKTSSAFNYFITLFPLFFWSLLREPCICTACSVDQVYTHLFQLPGLKKGAAKKTNRSRYDHLVVRPPSSVLSLVCYIYGFFISQCIHVHCSMVHPTLRTYCVYL
jgi:hypothetical protein